MKKTWIMLKRGILDPKHREAMGIRIWLYLHMLDRANWQVGAVLEWKDEAEADAMEMDLNTLRMQRRQLEEAGYIKSERRGHDQRVTILKWVNPREYSGKVYNPPDVAGTEEEASVESSPLEEIYDSASGSQSGRSSGSQNRSSPQEPSLDSQITSSQVRKNGGPAAASRSQTHWVEILARLQKELPRATFDTWVRDSECVSETDGELIIGVANAYGRDWLENRLTESAERAASYILGKPTTVRFRILEAATR